MEKLMSFRQSMSQLRPARIQKVDLVEKVQYLLTEAYSFFPTSVASIKGTLKDFPKDSVEDIINLFKFLKGKDKTPINIDLKKPKK